VVIIGILAMIAIPLFQKARQKSRRAALLNDARQIGTAAQQYMAEKNVTFINFTFTPSSGVTQDPLSHYVQRVSEGYINGNINIVTDGTFSLQHPQVRGGFNGDGNLGDPVYFTAAGLLYTN
jgi:type II secretory pathway pseudopilin PulG